MKLFKINLDSYCGQTSKDVAHKVLHRMAPLAAGISFVPGSALYLATLELAMMAEIARAYNLDPSEITMQMMVTQLGVRFGVSQGATYLAETLDFIPLVGNIAKGVVGGSVVYALGRAMIVYFESQYPNSIYGAQAARSRTSNSDL
jgi:uncharacterized protein (DUF697 family)